MTNKMSCTSLTLVAKGVTVKPLIYMHTYHVHTSGNECHFFSFHHIVHTCTYIVERTILRSISSMALSGKGVNDRAYGDSIEASVCWICARG